MTTVDDSAGTRLSAAAERPSAVLLSMHDLDRSMPYGMQRLGDHVDLAWTDRQHRGLWASRPPRAAAGAVRRWRPGWQGSLGAALARPLVRDGADVVFSIFENAGLGFARLQALTGRAGAPPHVMVVCWLAEDVQHLGEARRRSLRRSLRSVERIVVFSANQVAILADLGVDPRRVAVVPFGVDLDRYDAAAVAGPVGGGGLVAVGSDSRRDYATLFEAVRLAGVPLTLACQPRNLAGLEVPSSVTVRHDAFDEAYQRLLLAADLVVTPTVAPAYPSGQSVVLEAMAMGRPTLTTDSPAMRDYVEDDVTGFLTPPRSAAVMADRITELLADPPRRDRVAGAGRDQVRLRFGFDQMWSAVAGVLDEVLASAPQVSVSRRR